MPGKQIIQATSAGGIVYRRTELGVQIILVRYASRQVPGGVHDGMEIWEFPKGSVEKDKNETVEEAAVREVREEAGVNTRIEEKIDVQEYEFEHDGRTYHKQVHMFLMHYEDGNLEDHDKEVVEARWFDLSVAREKISFENNKITLEKAIAILSS